MEVNPRQLQQNHWDCRKTAEQKAKDRARLKKRGDRPRYPRGEGVGRACGYRMESPTSKHLWAVVIAAIVDQCACTRKLRVASTREASTLTEDICNKVIN